jgi:hypothetical protein
MADYQEVIDRALEKARIQSERDLKSLDGGCSNLWARSEPFSGGGSPRRTPTGVMMVRNLRSIQGEISDAIRATTQAINGDFGARLGNGGDGPRRGAGSR